MTGRLWFDTHATVAPISVPPRAAPSGARRGLLLPNRRPGQPQLAEPHVRHVDLAVVVRIERIIGTARVLPVLPRDERQVCIVDVAVVVYVTNETLRLRPRLRHDVGAQRADERLDRVGLRIWRRARV